MNVQNATLAVGIGIKIMMLVGIGIYGVFAWVLVAQEARLSKLIEEAYEPMLRFLVYVHFVATIVVFLLALLML